MVAGEDAMTSTLDTSTVSAASLHAILQVRLCMLSLSIANAF